MKRIQQGFTLIELMIVVAIIGILAAVAIPSYQDYIARTQVTEAVGLLSGFKTPIAEFRADKGHWPSGIGAAGSGESIEGTVAGKYTASVEQSAASQGQDSGDVIIVATMGTTGVNTRVSGRTVELMSRDGSVWTCRAGTTGTAIGAAYLPGGCK